MSMIFFVKIFSLKEAFHVGQKAFHQVLLVDKFFQVFQLEQ